MKEAEREVTVRTPQDIEQGLPETVSLLDKLRMAIYHGEFGPNHRLVESELAARYDTSRGAVREALVQLEGHAGENEDLRQAVKVLTEFNREGALDNVPFESVWTMINAVAKSAG